MMRSFDFLARRQGKSRFLIDSVKLAMAQGKRVFVATPDQARTVAELQAAMPGTLCEIVDDLYVRPHKRPQRKP